MPRPLFSHVLNLREHVSGAHRQDIPAVGTALLPADIVFLTNTSGGPLTLNGVPTVADGFDGQTCILVNTSANTITVQDQGTSAGSNLRLASNTIALGPRDSLQLIYSVDVGDWLQLATANVI